MELERGEGGGRHIQLLIAVMQLFSPCISRDTGHWEGLPSPFKVTRNHRSNFTVIPSPPNSFPLSFPFPLPFHFLPFPSSQIKFSIAFHHLLACLEWKQYIIERSDTQLCTNRIHNEQINSNVNLVYYLHKARSTHSSCYYIVMHTCLCLRYHCSPTTTMMA